MVRKLVILTGSLTFVASPLLVLSCSDKNEKLSPEKQAVNEVISNFKNIDTSRNGTGGISQATLDEWSTVDVHTQEIYRLDLTEEIATAIKLQNAQKFLESKNLNILYSLAKVGVQSSSTRNNWEYQMVLYVEYYEPLEGNGSINDDSVVLESGEAMMVLQSTSMNQEEVDSWNALQGIKNVPIKSAKHKDNLEQMLTWRSKDDTIPEHAPLPTSINEDALITLDFLTAEYLGIDFNYLLDKKVFAEGIELKYALSYDWSSGNSNNTNIDAKYNISFQVRYNGTIQYREIIRNTYPYQESNELNELQLAIENSGMKYIRSSLTSSQLDAKVSTPTTPIKFNYSDLSRELGINVDPVVIGENVTVGEKYKFVEGRFTLKKGNSINASPSKKIYELDGVLRIENNVDVKNVKLFVLSNEANDYMVYDKYMLPFVEKDLKPFTGSDDIDTLKTSIIETVNGFKAANPTRIVTTERIRFSYDINIDATSSPEVLEREVKKLRSLENNLRWQETESDHASIITTVNRFLSAYDKGDIDFSLLDGNTSIRQIPGENLIVSVEGTDESEFIRNKHVVFGAHMDLDPLNKNNLKGLGHSDNLSGVVSLLALAEDVIANPRPYTTKFAFFDAEELGQIGSKEFVYEKYLIDNGRDFDLIKLYVDVNSVVGGDYLYAAHGTKAYSNEIPHGNGADRKDYYNLMLEAASDKTVSMRRTNNILFDQNGNPTVYPYGKQNIYAATPASDFVNFSKAGIPIVSLVSSNYDIWGQNGKDVFYQTVEKRYWYPDPAAVADGDVTDAQKAMGIKGGPLNVPGVNKGGYDRKYEKGWGKIHASNMDNIDDMNQEMPNRVASQLEMVHEVLIEFLYKKIISV